MNDQPKKRLGAVRVTARAAEAYADFSGLSIDDAIADLERILPEAAETAEPGRYRYRRKSDRLDITVRVKDVQGVATAWTLDVRGYVSGKGAAKHQARAAALGIVPPPTKRRIVT